MKLPFKLNPVLDRLPVYEPGRPIEEVARDVGLSASKIIKLASNENPLGPSPAALSATKKAAPLAHLYPDGNAFYFKRTLAAKLRVKPENLVLGNGSNEIIEFLAHAMLGPGDNIVVSEYCFAIYPLVARLMGADVITVPAINYGHNLPAMQRAITPHTRILFMANPNNPTGTLAPAREVRRLVEEAPSNVVLVMDEAYIEFLDKPTDLLPLVRRGTRPNLILMRTFSKIYGLAGLRLGYGIGHPDFIAALQRIRQPFNVNALAQAAGLAALDDASHVARTRSNNLAGLQLFESTFRKMGVEFVPSHGNFILARVGEGRRVFEQMQTMGVITRPMDGYRLPEWIRISIGLPSENRRCLAALQTVVGKKI